MQTAEDNTARFAAEMRASLRWIRAVLDVGATPVDTAEGAQRTLDRYLGVLERIVVSATHADKMELLSACTVLTGNLMEWRDQARALTDIERGLLEAWPELLTRYLEETDGDTNSELARYLTDPAWSAVSSAFEAEAQASMLQVTERELVTAGGEVDGVGAAGSGAFAYSPRGQEPVWQSRVEEEEFLSLQFVLGDAGPGGEAEGFAVEAVQSCLTEQPQTAAISSDFSTTMQSMAGDEAAPDCAEPALDASPAGLADASPAVRGSSPAENEFVQLLRDELATDADAMTEMLVTMAAPGAGQALRTQALAGYLENIDRLALASAAIGLDGLRQVFTHVQANLPAADAESYEVSPGLRERLQAWPALVLDYLIDMGNVETSIAVVQHLQDTGWPQPLSADDALVLADLLSNPVLVSADAESEPRQTEAHAGDISLALPDDLNPELLDGLLQELPVQVGAFTSAMQRIATGAGAARDLEEAKRAAHTLKGAAHTVGVRGIANLTHHLEDILIALSKRGAMPNRPLAKTLMNAGDSLEAMSEALLGVGEEPADALQVFQEVLDWANRIDREGVPVQDETMAAGPEAVAETQPEKEETAGEPAQAATPMLRVPAGVVDEMLRLSGEMIISNGQLQERLRQSRKQGKTLAKQQTLFQQLTGELENLVDIRGAAARLQRGDSKDDFDPLEFEHYSELHTITRRLIEAASDGREMSAESEQSFTGLNDVLEEQHRLQIQSQDAVMRTRMVKVKSVFSRLQRGVRQTCRLLDKQVELKLVGADTYVDSNVLNDLVDPLMHVLRNAIDHGIEPAGLRLERGKSPAGRIDLSFGREGNYLVVRCKDDGAGLNLGAIRVAAEEKGMISADGMLSDDEVGRLILVPGFSTRTEATQVSGRGIGMDVVQSRVLEMKGSLNLHTETGRGLTVELRIPATLISTHGLLVRVREKLVAVSSRGVEDIHYVTPDQIKLLGNGFTYHVKGQVHEVVSFEVLLNLPEDRRHMTRAGFPALLVRLDSGALRVILVQDVVDSRDLVVKSLGRYVPKTKGVIGATILGDGSVASVIDLPELLRSPERAERSATDSGMTTMWAASGAQQAKRMALVVDDSLTARRAAAEVMRGAGFEVRMAMDGLEAVSLIEKLVPDIILADMEMPRMNGLEFTAHVRARASTKDVPVIMITSRSTDKHRQQANAAGVSAYLTKPFNGDLLLEQVAKLCGGR